MEGGESGFSAISEIPLPRREEISAMMSVLGFFIIQVVKECKYTKCIKALNASLFCYFFV
jgi:hypothetical protein